MRKGMTLSETLTVLTLIGVVAAMVIPTMYINVSEHKIITMLKKVYSAYNVNIQTVLNEKGCSTLSCLRVYDGKYDSANNLVDNGGAIINPGQHNGLLADRKYFKVTSKCLNCFKYHVGDDDHEGYGDILPDDDESYNGEAPQNFTSYILDNGAITAIKDFSGNCITKDKISDLTRRAPDPGDDDDPGEQNIPVCGILVIDANGTKGPNIPGKDRFGFYITDEPVQGTYLVPVGYNNSLFAGNTNIKIRSNEHTVSSVPNNNSTCTPGNTQAGYNCTAKVMAEGWKINY